MEYLKRYLRLFFQKEKKSWLKVLFFFNIYIPLGILCLIGLAIYINPLPPKTAYLAIGQGGSSYERISNNFEDFFKKQKIKLELIPTKGLGDGLKGLDTNDSEINASFLTVGYTSGKDYPNLVSLGSVQFAPIWIFYKGPEISANDPFQYFSNKKISIGLPGEATNTLYRKLYQISESGPIRNVLEISHKDGALALEEGKIDALFIVDGIQSETVKGLLKNTNIKIMNFPLADAYIKKLPYLQKLIVPKGSRSIEKVQPPQDITILASTTNLLIEKDTHRAIQWAFLLAAKESNRDSNAFFSSPDFFPRDVDRSFPLSPIAERFYKNGVPTIFSYMPIWVASLLDSIWVYIFAFFALIIPAIKLIEEARLYPSKGLMNKMFINLRVLDEAIIEAKTRQELEEILKMAHEYEQNITGLYVYGENSRFYFNLKNAVAGIKRDAQQKLEILKD
ncbi:hypothetical protein AOC19_04215 [Polynucleobacter asymbioticus]|uniref:TAXI family TRAP transporter solute-binding subunit n=1 Tax=Polynucleobacter asymbioticus TaxID=576611 RepID=UPI001BFDD553|nr:TAXI family TRAP transporter solute-binding subunit [Polynucleobacter asymbioticus]QWD86070.1 hypothetical protein AOC19_04215 [Polynucleobacter asymbioticus]